MPCAHTDIRFYDDLGCCLSCGEIVDSPKASVQEADHPPSNATYSLPLRSSYVYEDLQLGAGLEIRIVKLLPGTWTDPIRCSITFESLDNISDPYEAISYTWATEEGDDSTTSQIFCQDDFILVTKNCEAVLRRLRRTHRSRRLWVDAICINQSQIRERNHQVGIMDQIYLKASNVCICIEDPGQDYSECVNWLRTGGKGTSAAASQTMELFRKRYFTRVWVIQEVVLANFLTLQLNADTVLLSANRREPLFMEHQFREINVPKFLQNPASSTQNFITTCLRMSMHASSADPRDKIYGIISLLTPKTRAMIEVDYSRSYTRILQDAVMACVEECEDLTILLYIHSQVDVNESTNIFGQENLQNFLDNSVSVYDSLQSGRLSQLYILKHHPVKRLQHEKLYQFPSKPSHVVRRRWVPSVSTRMSDLTYVHDMERADARMPARSLVSRLLEPTRDDPDYHPFPQRQLIPCLQVRAHLVDISQGLMTIKARIIATQLSLITDFYGPLHQHWVTRYFQMPESQGILPFDDETHDDNGNKGRTQCNVHDVKIFRLYMETNELAENAFMFQTHYSVGFTTISHVVGDCVFAVDGVPEPLLLRPLGNETYRILGRCYLWAALELDYWNIGSHLGLWPDRPYDLGTAQTRWIKIY